MEIVGTTRETSRDSRKRKAASGASDERQLALAVSHPGDTHRWFIIFSWCPEARAVLARCSGSAALPYTLEALECGDAGCAWPAAECELPATLPRSARPYRWCQHLAGMDLMGSGVGADGAAAEGALDLARYRGEQRALKFVRLLRVRHAQLTSLLCASWHHLL